MLPLGSSMLPPTRDPKCGLRDGSRVREFESHIWAADFVGNLAELSLSLGDMFSE